MLLSLEVILYYVGRSDAEARAHVLALNGAYGNGIAVRDDVIRLLQVEFLSILVEDDELFHFIRSRVDGDVACDAAHEWESQFVVVVKL